MKRHGKIKSFYYVRFEAIHTLGKLSILDKYGQILVEKSQHLTQQALDSLCEMPFHTAGRTRKYTGSGKRTHSVLNSVPKSRGNLKELLHALTFDLWLWLPDFIPPALPYNTN